MLLVKPADIPEFIEDLPNRLTLAKKKFMRRREQTKPNALDEDQCEVQRCEDDDGDHDVLHPNGSLRPSRSRLFSTVTFLMMTQ
jgi:hypothetical protein